MANNNFIPWLGNGATSGNQSIYETIMANGFQVNGPIRADQNNAALRMSSLVAASIANAMPAFANKTIDSGAVDLSGTILGSNTAYSDGVITFNDSVKPKQTIYKWNARPGNSDFVKDDSHGSIAFITKTAISPGLYIFRFIDAVFSQTTWQQTPAILLTTDPVYNGCETLFNTNLSYTLYLQMSRADNKFYVSNIPSSLSTANWLNLQLIALGLYE